MSKAPTDENITHEADDAPGEPVLRECELLLRTHGEPELDLVRAHLFAIECALRKRNGEKVGRDFFGGDILGRIVSAEYERRGLTEHKRIRYGLDLVQAAIEACDVSNRSMAVLQARLTIADHRYADLAIDTMQCHLQRAIDAVGLPQGQTVGARATLAALMADVGAHDVELGDVKHAKSKINNARRSARASESTELPEHVAPDSFQADRLKK